MSGTTIELAGPGDVAAALALANDAAARGYASFATEPETLDAWRAVWESTRASHPWLVAREGDRVLGFAKASPHRTRGAYAWTAEVSVYVAPERHARGIGRALYRALVPALRAQGYVSLLAGIALPNAASVRLHEATGFTLAGVHRAVGWKMGAWRDVGYWEARLHPTSAPPLELRPIDAVWPNVLAALGGEVDLAPCELDAEGARALIAALDRELTATYPEPGATHFRLEAGEVAGAGALLVASLAGEPVGCGAVRAAGEGVMEIKRMYVDPRWRGLGISGRILDALAARARAEGATRLVLETGARSTAALALYGRRGWVPTEPFGEYVGSPTSVCLELRLAPAAPDVSRRASGTRGTSTPSP